MVYTSVCIRVDSCLIPNSCLSVSVRGFRLRPRFHPADSRSGGRKIGAQASFAPADFEEQTALKRAALSDTTGARWFIGSPTARFFVLPFTKPPALAAGLRSRTSRRDDQTPIADLSPAQIPAICWGALPREPKKGGLPTRPPFAVETSAPLRRGAGRGSQCPTP